MELSIIIVNYNTKDLTTACIKSIKRYPPKDNYEIIVVDNGSTDGSVKVLSAMAAKEKTLKFINGKENLGFARGNNLGIGKARGKYILLLNSDTLVKKGSVDKLMEFAKNNKGIGAAVPCLLNDDGSIQPSVFHFPTVGKNIQQWWLGKKGILDKYHPDADKPVEVDAAVMAAFLITPEALEKVGLLNERYFMFYEDIDYCRRLARASLKLFYIPESKVYHFHGKSGAALAPANKQWYRLLAGSRIYHGFINHYLIFFIQKSADVFNRRIKGIIKI